MSKQQSKADRKAQREQRKINRFNRRQPGYSLGVLSDPRQIFKKARQAASAVVQSETAPKRQALAAEEGRGAEERALIDAHNRAWEARMGEGASAATQTASRLRENTAALRKDAGDRLAQEEAGMLGAIQAEAASRRMDAQDMVAKARLQFAQRRSDLEARGRASQEAGEYIASAGETRAQSAAAAAGTASRHALETSRLGSEKRKTVLASEIRAIRATKASRTRDFADKFITAERAYGSQIAQLEQQAEALNLQGRVAAAKGKADEAKMLQAARDNELDRQLKRDTARETGRHNRATESNTRRGQDKPKGGGGKSGGKSGGKTARQPAWVQGRTDEWETARLIARMFRGNITLMRDFVWKTPAQREEAHMSPFAGKVPSIRAIRYAASWHANKKWAGAGGRKLHGEVVNWLRGN